MKILLPTDFSMQAEFAFLMAKKLAAKMPVHLELFHIIPCRTEARVTENGRIEAEDDSVEAFLQAKYMAALEGFKLYDANGFPEFSHAVAFGPLSESIISHAKQGDFDLIIMGTKGAYGLSEFISGSETQHVVRHSETPVLSLMCDRNDLEIKDILLVRDFNKERSKLPVKIKSFIQAFNARLHLLQIESPKVPPSQHSNEANIHNFVQENGLENIQIHHYADSGKERAVVHFNQMHNMDLILIGTDGRSGLQQIFQPSLAEKLVNHMHKPIITFHN